MHSYLAVISIKTELLQCISVGLGNLVIQRFETYALSAVRGTLLV